MPIAPDSAFIKLVLVGDTSVGKSCLITNYLNNTFTEEYEPTVLDVYRGEKCVNSRMVQIEINDTSGDEHLGVNRKIVYKGTDVFILCVAVNAPSSLSSVEKWMREIKGCARRHPSFSASRRVTCSRSSMRTPSTCLLST